MTDTTKLKPKGDKVLVKVATDEEVTASGIILTSAKHERKYEGVVVDVGDHEDIKKYGVDLKKIHFINETRLTFEKK